VLKYKPAKTGAQVKTMRNILFELSNQYGFTLQLCKKYSRPMAAVFL